MEKGILAVLTILMVVFAGALAYGLYVVSQPVEDVTTETVLVETNDNSDAVALLKDEIQNQIELNREAVAQYNDQLAKLNEQHKAELEEFKKLLEEKQAEEEKVEEAQLATPTVKAKFFELAFFESDSFNMAKCDEYDRRVENFLERDGDFDSAKEDFEESINTAKTTIDQFKAAALQARNLINSSTYNVTDMATFTTLIETTLPDLIDDIEDSIDDVEEDLKDLDDVKDLSSFNVVLNRVSSDAMNEHKELDQDFDDVDEKYDDEKYQSVRSKLDKIDEQADKIYDELKEALDDDFDELEEDVEDFEDRLQEVCNL